MSPDDLPEDASHERPFEDLIAARLGYQYVAYRTMDEARTDDDAIVILQGDDGGQIYLTCPLNKVRCSQDCLSRLLREMGYFSWGAGEEMFFERVRPDRFVSGGMGGGRVENDVWIHREFRNLFEIGLDILPEVKAVVDARSESVLPGIVERLVAYLEALDTSSVRQGQINYGKVADIANRLTWIGEPAVAALPVLRRLEMTGKFRLADSISKIERFEGAK